MNMFYKFQMYVLTVSNDNNLNFKLFQVSGLKWKTKYKAPKHLCKDVKIKKTPISLVFKCAGLKDKEKEICSDKHFYFFFIFSISLSAWVIPPSVC